jgi:hypothetical protein
MTEDRPEEAGEGVTTGGAIAGAVVASPAVVSARAPGTLTDLAQANYKAVLREFNQLYATDSGFEDSIEPDAGAEIDADAAPENGSSLARYAPFEDDTAVRDPERSLRRQGALAAEARDVGQTKPNRRRPRPCRRAHCERTAALRSESSTPTSATALRSFDIAVAEYENLLLRLIDSAGEDPRRLRHLVYRFARANLKSEAGEGVPAVRDTVQAAAALEAAIARIEMDIANRQRWESAAPPIATVADPAAPTASVQNLPAPRVVRPPLRPPRRGKRANDGGPALPSTAGERPLEIVYPEREKVEAQRVQRRIWLWFVIWPLIQLASVAGFCFALYLAVSGRLEFERSQPREVIVKEQPSSTSGLPLPTSYGVYAVSGGALSELQPLPIRAPDPRVQLSAEITKPSATILRDGRVAFILFERDLVNSAPRKVAVRVVARVASALTFGSGKAASVKPEASWHILGNAHDFLVSPLNESREMVVARPEDANLALAAGRYALVVGTLAYDFAVDGPITDPAQCLESVETTGGLVFNECKPK